MLFFVAFEFFAQRSKPNFEFGKVVGKIMLIIFVFR